MAEDVPPPKLTCFIRAGPNTPSYSILQRTAEGCCTFWNKHKLSKMYSCWMYDSKGRENEVPHG